MCTPEYVFADVDDYTIEKSESPPYQREIRISF